jgi:hypothetical protein
MSSVCPYEFWLSQAYFTLEMGVYECPSHTDRQTFMRFLPGS